MISGGAMVAGVVGSPVIHSLSPLIHNAWISASGLDAAYVPFSPGESGFEALVSGLRGGAIRGLNVTIPFKETALALADEADPLARLAGAANLLLFQPDGRIIARNTDGPGLVGAIEAQAPGFDLTAGPTVILGAGGAARGAAAVLVLAGAPQVWLVNRSLERAVALAGDLGGKGPGKVSAEVSAWRYDQSDALLDQARLVVNATSLGLGGGPGPPVDLSRLGPGAVVMDMVYKPLETGLLADARSRGLRSVDGLEMLIRQAIPSFEAFFGIPPPRDIDVRGLAMRSLGVG
jgi:shikimate dehydrogenase